MHGPGKESPADWLLDSLAPLPEPIANDQAVAEILRILKMIGRGGGATFSLRFGDQWRQPFYAVGIENEWTKTVGLDNFDFVLGQFVAEHRAMLLHPRSCVGVWYGQNKDGAHLYGLDVSVLVEEESVARDFGLRWNQMAIYYLQTGLVIEDIGGDALPAEDGLTPAERLDQLIQADRASREERQG